VFSCFNKNNFIEERFPDSHRFQQDNDPKHRSNMAKQFMEENGINWWTVWHSESTDINPIAVAAPFIRMHTGTTL
jgi:hypothetical protein